MPFGGIPFIGIGDFRQVAPVVKGSGCTPARLVSVKSSTLWPSFSVLSLEAPIRTARDPEYTAFVDHIGEDYMSSTVSLHLLHRLPSLRECIQFLYPLDILVDPLACLKRAFLTPKNVAVDDFNVNILDRLPGEECMHVYLSHKHKTNTFPGLFYSADSIKEDSEAPDEDISPDFLALQTHNGVPPHILRLKKGCICSIMRNMSVRKGLVKNARVIVKDLHRHFIEIQVINNRTNTLGQIHCIPRIRFEFSPLYSSWTIQCLQYPLRLAYACTFNGCVGLTLDKTVIDQRTPVFAHGQLYTALSRVCSSQDTAVLFNEREGPDMVNVVYRDLLL